MARDVEIKAAQDPVGFIDFLGRVAFDFDETAQGIIRQLIADPDQSTALKRLTPKQSYALFSSVSVNDHFNPVCENCTDTEFSWAEMPKHDNCGLCQKIWESIDKM